MKKVFIILMVSLFTFSSCVTVRKEFTRKMNSIEFTLESKNYKELPVVTVNISKNPLLPKYYNFIVDTGCAYSIFFDSKDNYEYIVINFLNYAFNANAFTKPKRNIPVKGMIGEDFLSQFKRVDFDYNKKIIEFDNPVLRTQAETDIEYITELGNIPIASIIIEDKEEKAIIDTGCQIPFIRRNVEMDIDISKINDLYKKIISQEMLIDIKEESSLEYIDFHFGSFYVSNACSVDFNDPNLQSMNPAVRGGMSFLNIIGSTLLCIFGENGRFQIDYENMKFRVY